MARTTGSIGENTSRELLASALRLFSRYGYAAVSMRQIAAETGVQAGAIYNHFPTKQALLHQLLMDHMHALLEAAAAGDFPRMEPVAALEKFVRFHIAYHIDKAEEVFIAYMELRNLDEENFKSVQVLRQQYERILRDILREGASRDVFRIADTPVTAMAIIAMLTGVNTWYRYGGRLSVSEIENIYVNMVMRSVGAEPARPQALKTEAIA